MGATMDEMTVERSDAGAVGPKPDPVDPRSSAGLAWGLWLVVVLVEGLVVAFQLTNDALTAAS